MSVASKTLIVDASPAAQSFDLDTYLTTFFTGLPQASYAFYGGTPDQAYGSTYYMNGSQLVFTFTGSDKIVVVDGADLAYDGIHSPGNGHGISGTITSITFGRADANTLPSDGVGGHGVLTGVIADVVMSGWDVTAAVGAGAVAGNPVYTIYNQLLKGGTDINAVPGFYQSIGTYNQHITGSQNDDNLSGGAYDDVIDGGDGSDTVSYSGNRADYTITKNVDGSFTVIDKWNPGPDGSDTVRNVEQFKFADATISAAVAADPTHFVTIDASGASAGLDFEAYIRGGFLADTTGGAMPIFDNGSAFSGSEMMEKFGDTPTSKYVLAHGSLEYFFGTHTVAGEINTIEYGTRGSGTYDSNGFFSGGDVELKITGLALANATPANPTEEADIEANGPVHNFALAHMYGAGADLAKLTKYADALDAVGQHFIGSRFNDVYSGTVHDDWIESGSGSDKLFASLGNDTIDGGADSDEVMFAGTKAEYTLVKNSDGNVVVARKDGTGTSTLKNVEIAKFSDVNVDLTTFVEEIAGQPPQNVALSHISVDENTAVGTLVGTLSATDPEGKAISYRLTNSAGGRFSLVENAIHVSGPLDHEAFGQHTIGVEAVDADGDVTPATVTIAVNDVNEAPADLFLSKASVRENADVGTRVGTLSALDPEGDAVTFTLATNAAGAFKLSGNNILLAKKLDFDKAQSHSVTVVATDSKGLSTKQVFKIEVDDVAKSIVANPMGGTIKGGNGIDVIHGSATTDKLYGGGGNDKLMGGNGNDFLAGQTGDDKLYGGNGTDNLIGASGNDELYGQAGNDHLTGGVGADKLWGGSGADVFVFNSARESTLDAAGRDRIYDFSLKGGDKIDLSGIDANSARKGNQAFTFIGKSEFHEKAGELRYEKVAGQTYLYGDVNGDGVADFSVQLSGAHNVTKAYFIL